MALDPDSTTIYWHRELPPRDAEAIGDHTIEATSHRIPGTPPLRDDLWDGCYHDLMDRVRVRIHQEIARLGGDCAHVVSEDIEPRRDERSGEMWMYGRFEYTLYRRHGNDPAGNKNTAKLSARSDTDSWTSVTASPGASTPLGDEQADGVRNA